MTDTRAAEIIAKALPELIHPGDNKHGPTPLPMMMFRNAAIPPEQAQQFATQAGLPHTNFPTLYAEAIIHALETEGKTIIDNTELTQLRQAATAAEPKRHQQVHIHCQCGTPLFKANLTDFNTNQPRISPQVIRAVQSLNPECAIRHGST